MTTLDTQQTTQATGEKQYIRFSATQRFEHMVLLVTFTVLGLTGMVQRYGDTSIGQTLIDAMGGIESIRIVHRIMAVILMAEVIFHGGVISYKLLVLGKRAGMMPGLRDVRDALHWIGFNLGLRKEHPRMPRYNFGEKVEYLAVAWGTLIMVVTGFMLWNPVTAASWLPGQVIPAAQLAHSAEALLAILSIIIWHMYNVHLKHFNRSMFTGTMGEAAMQEEHAEELEFIQGGGKAVPLSAEVIEKRRRLFIFYASVVTIILVGGLIWFVTTEETAIVTIPRAVDVAELSDFTPLVDIADSEQGMALWQAAGCGECHGQAAEGGEGPLNVALAGTTLDLNRFAMQVRRGPADMPPFTNTELDDESVAHIWAWLASLDAP